MVGVTGTASCVLLVSTEPSFISICKLLAVWNVVKQCIILTFCFVHKDRVGSWLWLKIAITASLVALVDWDIHNWSTTTASARSSSSSWLAILTRLCRYPTFARISSWGWPLRVGSVLGILGTDLEWFEFIFSEIGIAFTHSRLIRPLLLLLLLLI